MLSLRAPMRGRSNLDHTDAEIDRLGCGLYGLTEEEISIVEGK